MWMRVSSNVALVKSGSIWRGTYVSMRKSTKKRNPFGVSSVTCPFHADRRYGDIAVHIQAKNPINVTSAKRDSPEWKTVRWDAMNDRICRQFSFRKKSLAGNWIVQKLNLTRIFCCPKFCPLFSGSMMVFLHSTDNPPQYWTSSTLLNILRSTEHPPF